MVSIEANNIVKQYKNGVKALDNLSFQVKSGEIFTLLGPNGAGKSSLINILTTYYKPTAGSVTMLGKDLCKEPQNIRTQIACVAQQISIDTHLSLMDNMLFQSRLYKVDKATANKRIQSLIQDFDLIKYLQYPVASYSGGVKRRLDIAMNMVSSPKILFLDEPTVGMDVDSRKALWNILLKIKEDYNTTIFLTTHYLEEADQLSDSICIMKNGKEIAQGTPAELRNYIRQNMINITFLDVESRKLQREALMKTGLVKSTTVHDKSIYTVVDDSRTAFRDVNRWLLDQDIEFEAIEIAEPSLEDVFLALTGAESKGVI